MLSQILEVRSYKNLIHSILLGLIIRACPYVLIASLFLNFSDFARASEDVGIGTLLGEGYSSLDKGDLLEAERQFYLALVRDPENFSAHEGLVWTYQAMGEFGRAVQSDPSAGDLIHAPDAPSRCRPAQSPARY